MNITRKKLGDAVTENIISTEQADALFAFFQTQSQDAPKFSATHVLYYLGGCIAIAAMTLFMSLGWESLGGAGIVLISLVYAAIGLKCTNILSAKRLNVPAGICATFVVCLTPLALYGLQQWLGVWPARDVYQAPNWHWIFIEVGTLIVGAILAWKYKYPFLIMPIAITFWHLVADSAGILLGVQFRWGFSELLSLYTGLFLIGVAFLVDVKSRHNADYGFWVYMVGALAFWAGLTLQVFDSGLSNFIYFSINVLMIGLGVLLVRRVFVVLGALGSFGYLSYLAFDVFSESWLFPVALTSIGLGIIYLGIVWQKHEKNMAKKLRLLLPESFRELLEVRS
ncbi:MAG TPA: DUF2157 domain-containing protein [Aliidiomarina sp.]|nr:DUF2157 domain-containing protein [Aliidiomarina sp.]